tara:strand:+ start:252 stop:461 length:210 start_codon:yes stop_codon:yes gene_type:complete
MKMYAVAVCNMLNDENEVRIVNAYNEIDAMIIAVEGEDLGIIKMCTVEELQQYYIDLDLSVSRPVEIKK